MVLYYTVSGASRLHCKPFIVKGKILGQVPPYVFEQLENLKDVFCVKVDCVELQKSLKTPEDITHKIQIAMECLRDKGSLCSLKGWRNEVIKYFISYFSSIYSSCSILSIQHCSRLVVLLQQ